MGRIERMAEHAKQDVKTSNALEREAKEAEAQNTEQPEDTPR
ncbi:hypothetical protein [Amycolatopsis sp. NPDC051372]